MLAGAGRTKESTKKTAQIIKVPPEDLIQGKGNPARQTLTKTPFSAQHQNVSRGVPSRMITIPGTSDHHHLESVITIIWND
jgi:hypothetical protein